MRYVFDIETDGLLNQCTRMFVLVAKNLDTGKVHVYEEGDLSWKLLFNQAKLLAGHNIASFDCPVLEKLFGYTVKAKLHDTLIMSQVQNYRRFDMDGHSLDRWGRFLNFPKKDFNDFSEYSDEMREYCINDVELNFKVYEYLVNELKAISTKAPKITDYIRAEHAATKWSAAASLNGWPFDLQSAKILLQKLDDEMEKTRSALSSKLGYRVVPIDKKNGIVEPKKPRWTKNGFYDKHTADWFGVDPCSGFEGEERICEGPYTRIEIRQLDLNSVQDVKIFLDRNGWQPTEWNFKIDPNTGKKVKSSPKITEDSLEFLGGDGKLYTEFLTARSRYSILKTWIENTDENGNLHGDCMIIGTPSMRSRHSIIVNVPAADSPWGKEMRSLFTCKPGWKLIGCDSAGNQARGLAHYLGDPKFIDTLLNGDIHQYNADVLTSVVRALGIDTEVKRSQAKRVLYAFLFGASGGKLWSYIFGNIDDINGKKLKNGFLKAVPGFKALLDKLEKIYSSTSQMGSGYIPSLAGNRIYVDSYHKLLVYLLQSAEKITCSAALMLTAERLEKANIPYLPCIFYHDEIDFQVPEEHAEEAAAIGKQAFADGPKIFGIDIMDGGAKIGNNWYDVH